MKQLLILKPHILRGYVHRIQTVFWFVLLWVATALQLDAQTTLNGSLQLLPPYPAYLLDYTNTSAERAVLTLTSTNFEASSQRVRLKMLLEKGNSLMAYSSDAVIGEPTINLTPNIPVRLGTQLAPYFRLENLQGMSPDMYNRLLPEGMYRVTFEVYDYMTNTRMGSFSQQMWLVLNEPPQLNMPRNAENIQQTVSTATINFQWLPRAVQSASLTDYEFTLVEILDDYGNPVQQFMSSAPKYTTTVQTTTLALNPLSVNGGLIAGRTYAWRVRAKARQGVTTIALYKNDGYSDIFTFKYNGACAVPTGLQAQAKAYDQINLTWSPSSVHSSYRVAYRKYSTSTNWDWVEQTTSNIFLNLTGLEASTQYEIKVGGVCGPQLVSFTPSVLATTLAAGQVNGVSCGTSPTINITNQALQPTLYINDVIMAGDFPVTLTQVTGSNGVFSGTGYVKVPWLADTKISVTFNGIKVNTDKKLIGGLIETTFNPIAKNIGDLDSLANDLSGFLSNLINLGIDRDARFINDLIDKLKQEAAKELPDELKNQLLTALNNLGQAKKEYDDAKKLYDSLPNGAAKDAAKAAMDTAQQKFDNAKNEVKSVNDKRDQYLKDFSILIRKALKAILQDYNNGITAQKDKKVQEERNAGFSNTTISSTQNNGIEPEGDEVDASRFLSASQIDKYNKYFQEEYKLNRLELSRIFAQAKDNDDDAKILNNILKKDTKTLGTIIYDAKKANIAESDIILKIKEVIYQSIENALIEKIYKK